MSGLEALSVASSILQVISFAGEAARICKAVYNDQPTDNDEIKERALSLKGAAETTTQVCQAYQPHTKDEKKLKEIADQCAKTAAELEDRLGDLLCHNSPGNASKAMLVLFKTWMSKKSIERLENTLDGYKDILETHLLVSVLKRSDAIALQQKQDFQNLSKSLQSFITQYATGETQMSSLIRSENAALMHCTKQKISEAEVSVKGHITNEIKGINVQHTSEAERFRLLQSFHYREMNLRRNQIHPSYNDTFCWIFEDKDIRPESDKTFVKWLASDCQIYWISGKPGSGKSTLIKYLVDHPKALSLLNDSTEAPNEKFKIFSHFFWKVGGGLMNNLKGMWLSLTYQMLRTMPEISDYILAAYPSSTMKQFDSDWSGPEIREVFLAIIARCNSKVCIFLDGLDEVSTDDVDFRQKVVQDLCQSQNTKLCIASRPEWRLKMWLDKYPFIHLQDWTARDREEYAHGELEPFVKRNLLSTHLQGKLVETLVHKSMGVFLWMYLALRSVKLGLDNGDEPHDLFERVKSLPTEMEALYSGLWEKLSSDSPNYREKAARFFRLALEFGEHSHYGDFSILELAVMQKPHLQDLLLKMSSDVHYLDFASHCTKVVRDISIQCLGLVETVSVYNYNTIKDPPTELKTLVKSEDIYLRLMHRTVYDFLTGTVPGQEVLKHDSLPRTDLLVLRVKNMLATAVLLKNGQRQRQRWRKHTSYQIELQFTLNILSEAYRERSLTDDLTELLNLLRSWYMRGLAQFNVLLCSKERRLATFLAGCVHYSGGIHHPIILWVKQQFGENDEELATEVMHYLCHNDTHSIIGYESTNKWDGLRLMLSLKADIFGTIAQPMWDRRVPMIKEERSSFMVLLLSQNLSRSYSIGEESKRLDFLLDVLSRLLTTPNEDVSFAVYKARDYWYSEPTFFCGGKVPLPDEMSLSDATHSQEAIGVIIKVNLAFWIHMYRLTLLGFFNKSAQEVGSRDLDTWSSILKQLDLLEPYGKPSSGRIMYVLHQSSENYRILKMTDDSISLQLINDWFLQVQTDEHPRWLPNPCTLLSALSSHLGNDQVFERVTNDVLDVKDGKVLAEWYHESRINEKKAGENYASATGGRFIFKGEIS
ncbi:hypothetical protein RAB80_005637 [Fusarium oxysporum f. sp. vasinfectum]|uniref:NACHT domain-containing protein n=1 Tax=Fusarium oxysporum f. sp. vasinfectum 25433 TaxID=1089449 RepID=X0L2U5_FUSOX|nr:hypothetical protein FOTG_11823 [Fusarium oxysporum f. sp. vasinfectum 25433]KAK2676897.1 hypothetical protein RAB80_005637 [Fusarium oxysporum f. sp. vasinfectum]KAK2687702.1 hypothetical protein QWA68_013475 [Fusarium oxysporum]KAK2939675.1 hypothetical protein FoTM2_002894 [Fusarium oxysporum f. sp. vasinfectum]